MFSLCGSSEFFLKSKSSFKNQNSIILTFFKVQHALQLQVDRLQEDMRRVTNVIASEKEILAIIQNKCENLMLVHEIGQKQIAAAKKLTQEKQVEENMLRLRVHQIETEKHKEEKNIFSLEKLRLNLDQVSIYKPITKMNFLFF